MVIKQIPVDELESEERRSAVNEVNVLAMLKHPNIVAYYDNFMEDKSLMIAMEYAPGGTLYEFIQERNKNPLDEEVGCHVRERLVTMGARYSVHYTSPTPCLVEHNSILTLLILLIIFMLNKLPPSINCYLGEGASCVSQCFCICF